MCVIGIEPEPSIPSAHPSLKIKMHAKSQWTKHGAVGKIYATVWYDSLSRRTSKNQRGLFSNCPIALIDALMESAFSSIHLCKQR
jgi:hypothetical protein